VISQGKPGGRARKELSIAKSFSYYTIIYDSSNTGTLPEIRGILMVILALNWRVALAKILYGFASSQCSSMTADGFHSLSDGTSNLIGILGIHFACQPIDKDHPYGHKKYETFFSLVISAMLFILAFNLIKQGWMRISNPVTPKVDLGSFITMIATLLVNTWVMLYEFNKGRELKSDILISDSLHTRADIFTSLSVIASLIAIRIGFPWIDPVITILISLFIGYAALEIAKQSFGRTLRYRGIPGDKKSTKLS
jgi:cation diffusion facilitator family transporter